MLFMSQILCLTLYYIACNKLYDRFPMVSSHGKFLCMLFFSAIWLGIALFFTAAFWGPLQIALDSKVNGAGPILFLFLSTLAGMCASGLATGEL